jgi:hypothetical protein
VVRAPEPASFDAVSENSRSNHYQNTLSAVAAPTTLKMAPMETAFAVTAVSAPKVTGALKTSASVSTDP